jgi:hypothetical protein
MPTKRLRSRVVPAFSLSKRQRLELEATPAYGGKSDFDHHLLEQRESILSNLEYRDWAALTRVSTSWCTICQDPNLWRPRGAGLCLLNGYRYADYQLGAVMVFVITNWKRQSALFPLLHLCINLKKVMIFTTSGYDGIYFKLFNSLSKNGNITIISPRDNCLNVYSEYFSQLSFITGLVLDSPANVFILILIGKQN